MQIVPSQISSYRYKNERSVAFKIRQNPFPTLHQTPWSAGEGAPLPILHPTRHRPTLGARHASPPPQNSSQIYAYAFNIGWSDKLDERPYILLSDANHSTTPFA